MKVMATVAEDLSKNWGNYLKAGAVIFALAMWGYTAQMQWTKHSEDTKDTIRLLLLICKNSSPKITDKLECYNTIEHR